MKLLLLLPAVALTTAVSLAAATGFFVEAGAGVASFDGGDYSLNSIVAATPDPAANTVSVALGEAVWREDQSAAVFQVGAGYRFRDWLSLRVDYQHYGRTTTTSTADVIIAVDDLWSGDVTMAFSDRVQVVSFAPELRWQVAPKWALTLSPQLNWIFSDAELRTSSNSPVVQIIPLIERSADELTLGASVGLDYAITARLGLTARYRYQNLDVSWGRDAHVFSAGLRLAF